jgi:hypothetical protein
VDLTQPEPAPEAFPLEGKIVCRQIEKDEAKDQYQPSAVNYRV